MPQQARNTRLMAALTSGVSLGSVAGIDFAGKWGMLRPSPTLTAFTRGDYLVFLLALAFAFMRGGARAAVPLLWLCALACALIPATSVPAVLLSASGLWFYNRAATLAVDFTALLLALAFLFAAYRNSSVCSGPMPILSGISRRKPLVGQSLLVLGRVTDCGQAA